MMWPDLAPQECPAFTAKLANARKLADEVQRKIEDLQKLLDRG